MRRTSRVARVGLALVALASVCWPAADASGVSADWTTYLYNNQHTSFNAAASAITPSNVGSLTPAWTFDGPSTGSPAGRLYASPTVYNGKIYVGSNSGEFYRIDEATGVVDWHENLGTSPSLTCRGKGILSTAAVANNPSTGVLTVYIGAGDGNVDALRASDGLVLWQTPVNVDSATANDKYNFSSTLVDRGRVYQGISSSCDSPLTRGGLVEMDQATGAILHTYYTVPAGSVGASIWSSPAISTDGTAVYVTTGNGDQTPGALQGDSISVVRLNADTLAKEGIWTCASPQPGCSVPNDTDFGGSPTLFTANLSGVDTPMVGALDKNGFYYAFKQAPVGGNLQLVWSMNTGKSVSAAVWNGSHLFVVGFDSKGIVINGITYPNAVRELDPSDGHVIWETGIASAGLGFGSPTMNGGGVLTAVSYNVATGGSNGVYLFNANTGALLRTIPLTSATFAQPVFADQYLFVTDGGAADLSAYSAPAASNNDFSVGQTASPNPVVVDSQLTYSITVSNTGDGGPVSLTDYPPTQAKVESATPSQGSCAIGVTPVTCDLGSVIGTATIQLVVTPLMPGTITNTASVPADSTPADDTSSLATIARAQAKTKYVGVDNSGYSPPSTPIKPGHQIQWSFFSPGHSATDSSGFFDSGVRSTFGYYVQLLTSAGTYTVLDSGSANTSTVKALTNVAPLSGTISDTFTVTWASAPAGANQVYDVQLQSGTQWVDWQTGLTAPSAAFNSTSPGWIGSGTYRFRARLRSTVTSQMTGYSPASKSLVVS
jgi:outer membrane protein assembly factor BamB